MQTFLPSTRFKTSAQILDFRRLGKQRVEADQILRILQGQPSRWANHPAVKMWRGCDSSLIIYRNSMIQTWVERGYNNTMPILPIPDRVIWPSWLGNVDFHRAHRSNLLRKNKQFYGQFNWSEPDNLPYVWPLHNDLPL